MHLLHGNCIYQTVVLFRFHIYLPVFCLTFKLLIHVKPCDVGTGAEFLGHNTGTEYLPLLTL